MEKISIKEKICYGVGAVGKDFYSMLFSVYLMIFLTDVVGISPLAVGTLMVVARLWDAINDPIMGVIVDRTNTRFGKFRPYLLFVPIFMGMVVVALFTVPNLGVTGKVIWAYVFYILAGMSFTAYDVPFMSMATAISNEPNERTSLLSISRLFTMIAAVAVSASTLPMVGMLGGSDVAKGYQRFVIILVVISIPAAWIAFFNTKERYSSLGQKHSFKDYAKLIKNNKPFLLLLGITMFYMIASNLATGIQVYYFTYVLGKVELIPYLMMFTLLSFVSFAFIPALSKKFGKIKLTIFALLISIACYIFLFFFGGNTIALFQLLQLRVLLI